MQMPGRTFSGNGIGGADYRYDFNGKEDDKSSGWYTQDYGFRNYDYRLGRFFSQDPLFRQYPELTPYQFASNTPIQAIDLDGLEAEGATGGSSNESGGGGNVVNNGNPNGAFQHDYVRAQPPPNPFVANRFFERSATTGGSPAPPAAFAGPWVIPIAQGVEAAYYAILTYLGLRAGADLISSVSMDQTETDKRNWIVYQIQYSTVDTKTGEISGPSIYKYGISGQNPNPDGSYPRPETQVRKLNRDEMLALAEGDFADYRIYTPMTLTQQLTKLEAEYLEQMLVNAYYAKHGRQPEGNQRPLADPLKRSRRKKFEKVSKEFVDKVFQMIKQIKK